jgi:glutaminyl-peptide cyclotransferase
MKKLYVTIALLIGIIITISVISNDILRPKQVSSSPLNQTYSVVREYPHDTEAFTQGLVFVDGFLYEGTGLEGHSSLRLVDLETGAVLKKVNLPDEYFGEGIAVVDNRIIQLTWQSNIGFVYDKVSLKLIGNFSYPTEGWGLTYNGNHLIMSDGTSNLYFLDPETFERVGQVIVLDGTNPVTRLNELEYIKGYIYANIWLKEKIAIINPQTGQIEAWIDLTGLESTIINQANGIAYDQLNDRLFVTGKNWPKLYEIKIVPK